MDTLAFTGREHELQLLEDLLTKKVASIAVITGRRRVGKSRFIQEFAKNKKFLIFTGLPPAEATSAQSQRDEFSRQLSLQTKLPEVTVDDWSKAFLLLANETKQGRIIILLDEISWMGSKDPDFLGKLKNAWDLQFKKNPKLILVLCGSVSSWIAKNIINSTGFLGRIALKLTLTELPLKACSQLLEAINFKRSPLEKSMILSVTGGIPWYIESIYPTYSALENMRKLCFEKDGLLVDEFKFIFNDLFGRRGAICKKIVECLVEGSAEYNDIRKALNYSNSGSLSEYLEDLVTCGFIQRDFNWNFKSGKELGLSKFRLSDNYLRFYLKYIAPRLGKIKKNQFFTQSLSSLANWDGIMGLQFENLILNNRISVLKKMGIKLEDIMCDNPFFQRKTVKQKGCQIDYLIQTKHSTLLACEIKHSKNKIGLEVMTSVKEKLSRLALPKSFVCLPVLIHVNGVTEELQESDYFSHIIDFTELLD
jgi:AAA+ ATPase superfamily predicted ATPase